MSGPELKPCPFCGGKAELVSGRVSEDCMFAQVECDECCASGDEFEDAYAPTLEAIAAWNRRALPAQPAPAVGERHPDQTSPMTVGPEEFLSPDWAERKAREVAHSLPPSDFGSHRAIKAFAAALRETARAALSTEGA